MLWNPRDTHHYQQLTLYKSCNDVLCIYQTCVDHLHVLAQEAYLKSEKTSRSQVEQNIIKIIYLLIDLVWRCTKINYDI